MVRTLENNYFLMRTKLGYLRYSNCFESLWKFLGSQVSFQLKLKNVNWKNVRNSSSVNVSFIIFMYLIYISQTILSIAKLYMLYISHYIMRLVHMYNCFDITFRRLRFQRSMRISYRIFTWIIRMRS